MWELGGGQFTKNVFARNEMKCPDLHSTLMLPIHTHHEVGGIVMGVNLQKIFLHRSAHFIQVLENKFLEIVPILPLIPWVRACKHSFSEQIWTWHAVPGNNFWSFSSTPSLCIGASQSSLFVGALWSPSMSLGALQSPLSMVASWSLLYGGFSKYLYICRKRTKMCM